MNERERCYGSNSKFTEKKLREKKSQNDKGMVGRIVTIKCGIMRRRRARKGGE